MVILEQVEHVKFPKNHIKGNFPRQDQSIKWINSLSLVDQRIQISQLTRWLQEPKSKSSTDSLKNATSVSVFSPVKRVNKCALTVKNIIFNIHDLLLLGKNCTMVVYINKERLIKYDVDDMAQDTITLYFGYHHITANWIWRNFCVKNYVHGKYHI